MIDVTQETPSPRMDPDVLALAAFHAGDRGAGLRLFERHVRPVRRYFLNKVRQDGDADDLVHEVFQIMFNPESGFAAARSFGAYLFGVQQNVLRAYYRLRTDVAPTASVADFGASNSTWLERQERCQQLLVALRRLPIPQQEVLELHYWEDISGPRIAVLLDVPGGTVASRIRLAKQALLEGMGLRPEPAAYDEVLLALDQWAADIAGRLRGERPA